MSDCGAGGEVQAWTCFLLSCSLRWASSSAQSGRCGGEVASRKGRSVLLMQVSWGGCGKSSLPSSSCRMRFCATLRSYRKNSFVCRTSTRKLLSKEFSTSSSDKTFHRYLMKLHLVAKAVWPRQSLKNNCSVALESQNFDF